MHLLQAVDASQIAQSRRQFGEASRPLLHHLELLSTVAASPEYLGVPAVISEKVYQFHVTLQYRAQCTRNPGLAIRTIGVLLVIYYY